MSDSRTRDEKIERAHWMRLFDECANGTIVHDDKIALAALLKDNANARQLWFLFQDLELGLTEWVANSAAVSQASQTQVAAVATPSPRGVARFGRGVAGITVAAALLVAVIYGGFRMTSRPAAPGVARLVDLKNASWVNAGDALTVGDSLTKGQRIELSAGQARIEFGSGAIVTLFGPAIFEPLSANSGYLLIGQLKATAETPESKHFTIQTRTTRVVDIGTEFVASASADGHSRVDVTTGRVDVHLKGIKSPQHLRLGDALSIEPGERRIMARVESGDGTAQFRFPTIEPPSDRDFADRAFGRATINALAGKFGPYSGPLSSLLDGKGQSSSDAPKESVLFDEGQFGFLQLDLGQAVSIKKVNTYSWHIHRNRPNDRVRATQKFFLYGYAGDDSPGINGPLTDAGWVLLARVNTDETFGITQSENRPAQQASSITAANGSIGRFRYLLWQVLPSQGPDRRTLDNTLYGEIDVYAEP